jgi:signal transduction histidine kinase
LNTRSKLWLSAVGGSLALLAVGALFLPRSHGLTALSDLVQCFLLVSGTVAFIPLARRARGRMRLFWALISLGIAFWLIYQMLWTYYEVLLRRDVPDIFSGDVVLFLHFVPFMAALALRPHIPPDEYATRLGRLDFMLLLVWWLYVYVLIVIPWQYVVADPAAYGHNLNATYLGEQVAFLTALVAFWIGSKGQWRILYANLFVVGISYAISSSLANWALERNAYYTGSLYDIALAFPMAWLTWIGLRISPEAPQPATRAVSTVYGLWVARFSMISVFSLPLFAAWAMLQAGVQPQIRNFRVGLTLLAAFAMTVMVFIRQQLLDRELVNLLDHSRESFRSLKRLQAQILQSEKLASIGQLVGGAAHELNNPITAMLGYSDLLMSTHLTPEQQPVAVKIGQYVRRTRSLVASLISFARQAPAAKIPIDLNTLARTAVKLAQPHWEPAQIEVRTEFDPDLPKVLGDSNQLLQVCLQLVSNCLHIMSETGSKVLTVSTDQPKGTPVLQIAIEGRRSATSGEILPGTRIDVRVDTEDSVALSACQGIVQEHRGRIVYDHREDGAIRLRVELPAAEVVPARTDSSVPVLWQSRPYA